MYMYELAIGKWFVMNDDNENLIVREIVRGSGEKLAAKHIVHINGLGQNFRAVESRFLALADEHNRQIDEIKKNNNEREW